MLYKYLHDTTHMKIFRLERIKKRKKEDIKNRRMKNVVVFHHENSSILHHHAFFYKNAHGSKKNHDSSYFLSKVHGKVAFFTAGSQTSSDFKLISYSSKTVSFLPFFSAFFIHIHCVVKQVKVEFFFLLLLNIVNKHFRAEKYRPRTSYV